MPNRAFYKEKQFVYYLVDFMPGEPMAIEEIVAHYWELRGYLTRVRVNYKVNTGNGDIDVIAFDLKRKNYPIIISVKAWGGPEDYYFFSVTHKHDFNDLYYYLEKSFSPEALARVKELSGCFPREGILYVPGSIESALVKKLSKKFYQKYRLRVNIVGLHEVIAGLLDEMIEHATIHRTRYASTDLEFIRWLIRCVNKQAINLLKYQNRILIQRKLFSKKDQIKFLKDCFFKTIQETIGFKQDQHDPVYYTLVALDSAQGNGNKFVTQSELLAAACKTYKYADWQNMRNALRRLTKYGLVTSVTENRYIEYKLTDGFRETVQNYIDF